MQRYFSRHSQPSLWTYAVGLAFSMLFLGTLIVALPIMLLLAVILLLASGVIGRKRISAIISQLWQQKRTRYRRDIYDESPNVEREAHRPYQGRVFEHHE